MNHPRVKAIIEDIAKKHNRSVEDVREMIMWEWQYVVEKIRSTPEDKTLYSINLPGFGTFKPKLSYKKAVLKRGQDE